MRIYTCWITCMLESYRDEIVAGLIKMGYTVGLASTGKTTVNYSDQVSAIIALTVYKISDEELPVKVAYQDLSSVLNDMKAYFYSVVISESNNATWTGSNIVLQDPKKIPQLPAKPDDTKKSKLN